MLILRTVIAAFLSLSVLFAFTKLMGNKQMSQLNMFDYINGITIGSIAAEMAIAKDFKDFVVTLAAIAVYGLVGFFLSEITMKSIKCRRFFSGEACLLIEKGKIYKSNLKKAKLDINDLLTMARCEGYYNISDVQYAVMENNGKVSFLAKSEKRPVNPSDINISPQPEGILSNVIIDGKVLSQNLRKTGKEEQWLKNQLSIQGFGSPEDVILAAVDENGKLFCFEMIEKKNDKNVFD